MQRNDCRYGSLCKSLQVFIWLFRDNNLQGISFLDMHFYIHQLVGVRNLALACDIYRSVALLRYQVSFSERFIRR